MKQFRTITNEDVRGQMVFSSVTCFERKSYADSPSVKMVLSGEEHYQIDNRPYSLIPGHFLQLDQNSHVELQVHSKEPVKGVCIFPDKDLLNEVAQTRLRSGQALLDDPFPNKEINLIHNQFKFRDTRTGNYLSNQLPGILDLQNKEGVFNPELFFMGLAECMIDDQLDLEGKLTQISTIKKTTKEELYRRVLASRDYLRDNFTQKINLDDLASVALLSKYHYTRTFKSLFGHSPYRYLLQLRLNKAQELLTLDYSYNEITHMVGFSDVKNLRKAMKLQVHTHN